MNTGVIRSVLTRGEGGLDDGSGCGEDILVFIAGTHFMSLVIGPVFC